MITVLPSSSSSRREDDDEEEEEEEEEARLRVAGVATGRRPHQ
jgi:hypothetical protein